MSSVQEVHAVFVYRKSIDRWVVLEWHIDRADAKHAVDYHLMEGLDVEYRKLELTLPLPDVRR